MNILLTKFFKYDGEKILLNTYKCEIYVPDSYFTAKMAVKDGEIFDILFILKYRLFHTEEAEKSPSVPVYDFLLPTMILTKPDDIRIEEMNLYGIKEKVHVLTYFKNGQIVYNKGIIKSSTLVERFVTLFNNGKMRMPYKKANYILNRVQKIHDTKLNVPQYIQEMLISEIYRSKSNLEIAARFVASVDDVNDDKIRGVNMRENAAFTSTLAGVAFEDINSMLTVADNREDKDSSEYTPIERAIRGLRPT